MKQYPKSQNNCPFCDSNNLDGGEWDAEGTMSWQRIECIDCGKKWDDIYTLQGYEEDN